MPRSHPRLVSPFEPKGAKRSPVVPDCDDWPTQHEGRRFSCVASACSALRLPHAWLGADQAVRRISSHMEEAEWLVEFVN